MGYYHRQELPLWIRLLQWVIACLLVLMGYADDQVPFYVGLIAATIFLGACAMFQSLTIRDEGASLLLEYGPLPAFWKRIFYAEITRVEPCQSSWIDGWGIHYVPFRGWTFNLYGFECVEICRGKRTIRLGTDDPENLAAAIRAKLPAAGAT